MVRQIIWSANAKADRVEILKYWISRNKSNSYSKKLNKLFKQAINLIARNPGIGHLTVKKDVRVKIVRDYLIVYRPLKMLYTSSQYLMAEEIPKNLLKDYKKIR